MHLEVGGVTESFAALVAGVNQRVLKQNKQFIITNLNKLQLVLIYIVEKYTSRKSGFVRPWIDAVIEKYNV